VQVIFILAFLFDDEVILEMLSYVTFSVIFTDQTTDCSKVTCECEVSLLIGKS